MQHTAKCYSAQQIRHVSARLQELVQFPDTENKLQCAAVCCSILQCVAVHSTVLPCVAVCCKVHLLADKNRSSIQIMQKPVGACTHVRL